MEGNPAKLIWLISLAGLALADCILVAQGKQSLSDVSWEIRSEHASFGAVISGLTLGIAYHLAIDNPRKKR